MSAETDLLLDRIAKLKAKAEGTSNQAEAEVFAAKVAEMLAKHNLDEAMLRARDATREQGPIGSHPFSKRVPDAWREYIVVGVARLYQCQTVFNKVNGKTDQWSWRFVGREHNAVVAISMADWLIATVKRMAAEHSTIKSVQKNFRKGAADRLYKRLYDLAEAQRAPTGTGDGTALMIRTEDQAIADYLGDINQSKMKSHKHGAGSAAGWKAADSINLSPQVTETRAERLLA